MVLQALLFVATFWIVHLVIAGLVSAPIIVFGRNRAQWQRWELVIFVVPYLTWSICMVVDDSGKSMSNVAIELLAVTASVPIGVFIRCSVGHPNWRGIVTVGITAIISCFAVGLWAFLPGLPE